MSHLGVRHGSALGCVLLSSAVACTSFSATDSNPADAAMQADAGPHAASPGPDAAAPSTLGAGLLARWRFDEGMGVVASNDVASAPAGAITNATWGAGQLGGALVFDGATSFVKVAGSPTLDVTTAFTLAVWANVADLATDSGQRFLSRGPLDFKLNGARPQISISGTSYASSSFTFHVNEWHHVTAVYAANKAKIYVDGIVTSLSEDTFGSEAIAPQTNALWIGVREGASDFFNGRLDDVRMWNRALSDAEVAELYAAR